MIKTYRFRNGDEMPLFGLGTWKSEKGVVYDAVREAIRIGYRHIDCAYIYGNEEEIGQALQDAFKEGDVKREDLWVTSKLWNSFHSKEDVPEAIQKSLTALQLDYLDLYLIHWPVALKKDFSFPPTKEDMISLSETPLTETWSGMEECKDKGWAKHIGVSNFNQHKIALINESANHPIECNQVESHPLLQQDDLFSFCKKHHIIMTAYSPLGSKDRTNRADDEPDMFTNKTIVSIAAAHHVTPPQIMIAWAINRGTSVIPKSANAERLKQNFEGAQIKLSTKEMSDLAELDRGYRYLNGKLFAPQDSSYTVDSIWND